MRVDDRKVAVRRRIAVMLVVVVVVFVVCIIPDAVMSALYLGYTESDSCVAFKVTSLVIDDLKVTRRQPQGHNLKIKVAGFEYKI